MEDKLRSIYTAINEMSGKRAKIDTENILITQLDQDVDEHIYHAFFEGSEG